jgi:hypothetical protein
MHASINYAFKNMNRDGSLNEIYPYERSFCVTAFFLYYASEALVVCNQRPYNELGKIAGWVVKNTSKELSNQVAAAATALYNMHLLTKEDKYRIAADEKIRQLINAQSQHGIFPEYAGLDIGYLSITLAILSKYHQKTNDKVLYSACKDSLSAIDKKINKFGEYDYEENVRKTQYLYPYGFLYFKNDIFNRILLGIEEDRIINPSWMDDKYVIPLTIDYLEAYLAAKR